MNLFSFWSVIKSLRFGPLFFIVRLLSLVIMMIIEIDYSIKNPLNDFYYLTRIVFNGIHGWIKFWWLCIFLVIWFRWIGLSIFDYMYKIIPNRWKYYFFYSLYWILIFILVSIILNLLLFFSFKQYITYQCESKEKISYNWRLKISPSMSAVDWPWSYTEINWEKYRTNNYEFFENWGEKNWYSNNQNTWRLNNWVTRNTNNPYNSRDWFLIKWSGFISYEMWWCFWWECFGGNYNDKCFWYFTIEHLSKR